MLLELVALFARSKSLRIGTLAIAVSAIVLIQALAVVNGLRPDSNIQANQLLGRAQFVLSLPASAPLGVDNSKDTSALARSIATASGGRVSTEYLLTRARPDLTVGKYFQIRELTNIRTREPDAALLQGHWPLKPGEAVISSRGRALLGTLRGLQFFGGALRVHIVGTYVDDLSRKQPSIILGTGTWDSLKVESRSRRAFLDTAATRNFYATGKNAAAALRSVQRYATVSPELRRSLTVDPAQVQTRQQMLAIRLNPIFQLTLAAIIVPLTAGTVMGAAGGRFVGRTRRLMWTLGIALRKTRAAAITTVLLLATGAALAGVVCGFALLPLTLLALNPFSDQRLSAQHGLFSASLTFIVISVLSSLAGVMLVAPTVRETRNTLRNRVANRRLVGLLLFVALAVGGIFAIQGKSDATSVSIAGTAFSAALLTVAVPIVGLALKVQPRALLILLAMRRAGSDQASTSIIVYLIGVLTVLGIGLATVLTSTYAAVNAGNAASIPPGQIVVAPELADDNDNYALASAFQTAMQLPPPIIVRTADQGPDDGDGALAVVSTIHEASVFTGAAISATSRRVLEDGGVLTSRPHPSGITSIEAEGSFRGARFRSRYLKGANIGFTHWHGVLLSEPAVKAGLHAIAPRFVFANTTRAQRGAVLGQVARLGINPGWVQTYKGPDIFLPPSSYVVVSGSVVLLSGLISYILVLLDARGLTASAMTLLDIGLRRSFIMRLLLVKTAMLMVLATAAGLLASLAGSAIAFTFSTLPFPLVLPLREVALQVALTVAVAVLGAVVATRRLVSTRAVILDPLANQ